MLLRIRRSLLGFAVRRAPMWLRYLYPTPKLDVRAAVFDADAVLMVRDLSGGWSLPGGWIDLGESPGAAAAREVREESGHIVVPRKLLAVSNLTHRRDGRRMRVNVLRLFVACELDGSAATTSRSAETVESAFFRESDLPLLATGRGTPEELRLVFEHLREPDRPCDFDVVSRPGLGGPPSA